MDNSIDIVQYLKENGSLTYSFTGTSMNPLIKQDRDFFTVVPKSAERCDKYDVVLYRRNAKQLVLHRIVSVQDKDYVVLGDNCVNKEYGIKDADIIGVMSSFIRKGTTISVTDWRYRLYVSIWVIIHPIIILNKRISWRLSRVLKQHFHWLFSN